MVVPEWMANRQRRGLRAGLVALGVVGVLAPVAVGAQSATDDPSQLEAGQTVYESSCAGCHGADGTGTNAGRPLTGIAGQEPDRLVHVASVTDGKGGMPAFADELSADEIDAAVTYVRLSFSGSGPLDSLPRTGTSTGLYLLAGSLLVTGAAASEISRRFGADRG